MLTVNILTCAASYLPAKVSVVHVTHKQRLGGESIGLDVDIRSGHLTKEDGYIMLTRHFSKRGLVHPGNNKNTLQLPHSE